MAKNIVLCLDGTGNQLKARGNTNVVALYQMLDLRDPTRQIAYYSPGVGTFSDASAFTPVQRRLSRLTGLALGTGMRKNIAEAYTFLMRTYEPGDAIFLIGFSRGAYTARALAGMLALIGLVRPGSDNLVPYAVRAYARRAGAKARENPGDDYWKTAHEFAGTFARLSNTTPPTRRRDERTGIPIAFVGLWDSVKATGILRWDIKWPFTRQLRNTAVVRHAISIDEHRRPYREYLVSPLRRGADQQRIDEAWFAGVHSDVGGTFVDDARLSRVTLKWMVDGALDAGLLLRPGAYDQQCAVTEADASGTVHRMGIAWLLVGRRSRPIPAGSRLHASVRSRMAAAPGYRAALAGREDLSWVDEQWLAPHSLAGGPAVDARPQTIDALLRTDPGPDAAPEPDAAPAPEWPPAPEPA